MDKRINLNQEVRSARALNTAPDSENQIHGDDMAREFGFRGGLVPGVTVSAYLLHPIIEKWEIDWLEKALSAEELTLSDLPLAQLRRLVSEENKVIVSATPSIDVLPVESLRYFTESVLSVADEFTGRPVLDLGIGDIVVKSFWTAIFLACSGIFLILLFTLKSITDSVLVFIPLLITAFFTLAVSWIIDLPLNLSLIHI